MITIKNSFLFIVITFTLAALLHVGEYFSLPISSPLLFITRITFLLSVFIYCVIKRKLPQWIFFAMLAGIELGYDFPNIASELDILSKIFLKLIKSIIAPLIFATLVVGIAGHSNLKQVGRIAWKSILYFYIATTLALFIGLAAINISKAGVGIAVPADTGALPEIKKQNWQDILLHIFPENIAKSVAEGQVLQVVIFSIIFGIGLAMLNERMKRPVLEFSESMAEVMFKYTNIVMYFAPIGVGGAIAYTVSKMGIQVLLNGLYLVLTLYVALILFVVLVLLPAAIIFKLNIKNLIKAVSEPFTLAFATASSESALPKAMKNMEKFGVPRKIVSFVMPLGYSFNLDGTTLYLSLASIFVAQACQVPMTFGQQLFLVFTLMITSKGVAGVPRASFVILLGTISSFGLKEWPLYIILGIDALMDMARTSINVLGNCIASAVVARWENELDDKAMLQYDNLSE